MTSFPVTPHPADDGGCRRFSGIQSRPRKKEGTTCCAQQLIPFVPWNVDVNGSSDLMGFLKKNSVRTCSRSRSITSENVEFRSQFTSIGSVNQLCLDPELAIEWKDDSFMFPTFYEVT